MEEGKNIESAGGKERKIHVMRPSICREVILNVYYKVVLIAGII